jgi:hypothetical protein
MNLRIIKHNVTKFSGNFEVWNHVGIRQIMDKFENTLMWGTKAL